jgi:hypothetical protein
MPKATHESEEARRETREQKREKKAALRQARRERKSNCEAQSMTFEKGSL